MVWGRGGVGVCAFAMDVDVIDGCVRVCHVGVVGGCVGVCVLCCRETKVATTRTS